MPEKKKPKQAANKKKPTEQKKPNQPIKKDPVQKKIDSELDNDPEDSTEQPPDELTNSTLLGRRVKLLNGHPHAGQTGTITRVELVYAYNRYVPRVSFDDPDYSPESCLVMDANQIKFLDGSEIPERTEPITTSQNSQGYKLPDDETLIESFWEHHGNIEMVSQSYGVRRRTVHLRIENDATGNLKKELELARKAAIPYVESLSLRSAKGYDVWEDKIFNANGVPLVVPTIKHFKADIKAQELWLSGNDPRYQKIKEDSTTLNIEKIIYRLPDNGRRKDLR